MLDRMSQLLIHDSSNVDEQSDHDNDKDSHPVPVKHQRKVYESKKVVDKRLVKILSLMSAKEKDKDV